MTIGQLLSTILKPLAFASKDNFSHIGAIKNLEPLVQNLCQKALSLPIPADTARGIKELQEVFTGFDGLGLVEKKERVGKGMGIIRRVQGFEGSRVQGFKMDDQKRQGSGGKRLSIVCGQWSEKTVVSSQKGQRSEPLLEDVSIDEVKERLARLSTPIEKVKGIGPRLAALFKKKGLDTVEDILYFLPIRYEDRREIKSISHLMPGTRGLTTGEILALGEVFYGRRRVFEMAVGDGSGLLKAKWFNYSLPVMRKRFKIGQRVILYGEVSQFRGHKEIVHPDIETLEKGEGSGSQGIIPIYSQIGPLYQKTLRRIIRGIVEEYFKDAVGVLPQDVMERYHLLELSHAIQETHIPEGTGFKWGMEGRIGTKDWPPRKTLVFDELFSLELGLALKRRQVGIETGIAFNTDSKLVGRLRGLLPYTLTRAQEKAIEEIKADMASPHPMNRLLQGDVGSGKTIVALAASLIAIENGYQVAIMAPTEILAEQHYLNIHRYGEALGVRVSLLTSNLTRSEKTMTLEGVKRGRIDLSIGTHALIQEDVGFKALGLVIIDEQHRFGVVQRATLKRKGVNPDVLVMTATPIPRTLAMTVFGDMDVSIIDEPPPGRQPITTKVFRERDRGEVYKLIHAELKMGKQAYIVYPLVEGSEELDLRDATNMAQHLQRDIFPHYRIGLLHGRMKGDEKERIMREFKGRDIDILVATTVIEVGIDIPNATIMVVEHAERFGLAQLHQLRGRVGRGKHKSWCLLLTYRIGSEDTYRRLKVMEETNDGFRIAEEDLKIRGPGDFLGTRQSGLPDFRVADLVEDISILQRARDEAFGLIRRDPNLDNHPILKEVLKARWKGRLELATVG